MHGVLTLIMPQHKVNMSSFTDNAQDVYSHNYFSHNQWKWHTQHVVRVYSSCGQGQPANQGSAESGPAFSLSSAELHP